MLRWGSANRGSYNSTVDRSSNSHWVSQIKIRSNISSESYEVSGSSFELASSKNPAAHSGIKQSTRGSEGRVVLSGRKVRRAKGRKGAGGSEGEERTWLESRDREKGGGRGRGQERARTETRASPTPPFSPFTYTTAAGNGIANPTTLHASWQLVISRPILRQHTPRYVSQPTLLFIILSSLHPIPPPTHQPRTSITLSFHPRTPAGSLERITRSQINGVAEPRYSCGCDVRCSLEGSLRDVYPPPPGAIEGATFLLVNGPLSWTLGGQELQEFQESPRVTPDYRLGRRQETRVDSRILREWRHFVSVGNCNALCLYQTMSGYP
ncbi:hypothetical protein KM043_018398 [Ampulex compressa]|nr:hypothetical protein KM043_018398 [Ampulex compressa]